MSIIHKDLARCDVCGSVVGVTFDYEPDPDGLHRLSEQVKEFWRGHCRLGPKHKEKDNLER